MDHRPTLVVLSCCGCRNGRPGQICSLRIRLNVAALCSAVQCSAPEAGVAWRGVMGRGTTCCDGDRRTQVMRDM